MRRAILDRVHQNAHGPQKLQSRASCFGSSETGSGTRGIPGWGRDTEPRGAARSAGGTQSILECPSDLGIITSVKPSERLSPPVRWGIVVVLLAAAVLRLAALPELPLGLHYDEAANLILTRQIVEEGYRPLFIRAYTGKEVFFFYAAAPWVWMTGGAVWGMRLGAAMLGILTVSASFSAVRALLARRPGGIRIALFAAGWLALAFPHVLLSRYGFRAISQPLLQALVVATLWRGLRTGKRKWLIPAGALLGLTAYTYLAARVFPIPLALSLAFLLVRTVAADRGRLLGRYALVLVAALIFLAPLGVFFLQNPETFLTRINQVAAPSLSAAARGVGRCLRAIVWPGGGDGYIRFNVPGVPLMRPAAAVLALVGAGGMLFARSHHPLEQAGRRLVLLSVLVMVLPSALATGEITPSNLRMVGLYPFIALLPAWGLYVVLAQAPAGWLGRLMLLGAMLGGEVVDRRRDPGLAGAGRCGGSGAGADDAGGALARRSHTELDDAPL